MENFFKPRKINIVDLILIILIAISFFVHLGLYNKTKELEKAIMVNEHSEMDLYKRIFKNERSIKDLDPILNTINVKLNLK